MARNHMRNDFVFIAEIHNKAAMKCHSVAITITGQKRQK